MHKAAIREAYRGEKTRNISGFVWPVYGKTTRLQLPSILQPQSAQRGVWFRAGTVKGLGFRAYGVKFRVQRFTSEMAKRLRRFLDLGFRVLRLRVHGLRCQGLALRGQIPTAPEPYMLVYMVTLQLWLRLRLRCYMPTSVAYLHH